MSTLPMARLAAEADVPAAAWSLLDGSRSPSESAYRGVPDELAHRAATESATLASRPSGPYWFLDCVGTAPAHQRRGYARQLVARALERLDDDRLPAAVETSSESNVALYERLGFEPTALLHLGPGVPPVWVMTRPFRPR